MLLNDKQPRRLAARTILVTASVICVISAALIFWAAFDVFLLLFAGVLFAVLLCGLSNSVAARAGFSYGWSLALVSVTLVMCGGLIGWWLAPGISDEIDELGRKIPESLQKLKVFLGRNEWSRAILDQAPAGGDLLPRRSDIVQRVTGVFSNVLGALTSALVVVFTGLFLAADPGLYRRGLIRLIPVHRRARAREVLDAVGESLWWWLIAKFGSMAVVGVLTYIGLWALKIPLAFSLAILAALLTFLPNIGPIIAAVPAVLLALLESPSLALWAALLYLTIQTVESYFITPVFEQRAVSLPPVLVMAAQLLMGVFAGVVGLIVATPLTTVFFVLINELYVKDVIEDHAHE